ncbi:AEC family transporter [Maritimibacter sp. DP1N21-5]|uniref:AEC family transporter n=1 Tax=Maritimibacter sp. DP1N21-5 TaxID=2836867 RepID=UPI001C444CBB|nr:AEC family transporter [Maritimibacter sp. DP1N21-5]MBV7409666.1 AEC family transporter [Maritimibacter sp. DP1N21-5]
MLFTTIWPLFALIVLGFGLARAGFPSREFWASAERLNYYTLFPALLITSLVRAPMGDPAILRLGGAAVVTILVATALMLAGRALRPTPPSRFGPALQGVIRFNTYLGLAVTGSLLGTEGLTRAAVYLAVAVPLVNVISIFALTDGRTLRRPGMLARMLLTNPLILGCLIGATLALSGIGLPFGTDGFLDLLARASLPLGLLCVGAALQPATLRREIGVLAGNAALRLAALPVLAFGIGWALDLPETEALVLVIFSAIPTATSAYVLTRQMGGDGTFMAGIVTLQTLASVVTIPLVLLILG